MANTSFSGKERKESLENRTEQNRKVGESVLEGLSLTGEGQPQPTEQQSRAKGRLQKLHR